MDPGSQFNWVFDNMGGTPLQEAVAGNWHQAVAAVDEAGCVAITVPNPGGGQVCWVRGVWPADTTFPWEGFWAEPMGGDLTNYYPGGSFANEATSPPSPWGRRCRREPWCSSTIFITPGSRPQI